MTDNESVSLEAATDANGDVNEKRGPSSGADDGRSGAIKPQSTNEATRELRDDRQSGWRKDDVNPITGELSISAKEGRWSSGDVTKQGARFIFRHALSVVLIVIALAFALVNSHFASLGNIEVIFLAAAPIGLITVGESFVMITAGIDLSVGSIIGFSGVVFALLLTMHVGFIEALLIGVVAGTAVGLLNGLIVAYAGVTPFITTLGTLYGALSAGYILSSGEPVSSDNHDFLRFAISKVIDVPTIIWIAVLTFVVFGLLLQRTNFGTHTYAVGGNLLAARLTGIKVKRLVALSYVISGFLAGIAGVILASRITSGIATTGSGYELTAIAAAVIGGVSLFGGRGKVWGVAIGVILLTMLVNGLDVLDVSPFFEDLVEGALIVVAVFLDGLYRRVYGET